VKQSEAGGYGSRLVKALRHAVESLAGENLRRSDGSQCMYGTVYVT
jgi:hypothetical protein